MIAHFMNKEKEAALKGDAEPESAEEHYYKLPTEKPMEIREICPCWLAAVIEEFTQDVTCGTNSPDMDARDQQNAVVKLRWQVPIKLAEAIESLAKAAYNLGRASMTNRCPYVALRIDTDRDVALGIDTDRGEPAPW